MHYEIHDLDNIHYLFLDDASADRLFCHHSHDKHYLELFLEPYAQYREPPWLQWIWYFSKINAIIRSGIFDYRT